MPPEPPEPPEPPADSLALMLRSALAEGQRPDAERVTSPHGLAAQTLSKLFKIESSALSENLETAALAINGGELNGLEGTLASQAATLNGIFHRLTQHSFDGPRSPDEFATYLKLALRAQSQSTRALEVLANIKQGPRVVIAGQLNAAQQQIIHNANIAPSEATRIVRSAKTKNPSRASARVTSLPAPEINHSTPYEMDPRSQSETTPDGPKMAAMEKIHRTPHPQWKANQQS